MTSAPVNRTSSCVGFRSSISRSPTVTLVTNAPVASWTRNAGIGALPSGASGRSAAALMSLGIARFWVTDSRIVPLGQARKALQRTCDSPRRCLVHLGARTVSIEDLRGRALGDAERRGRSTVLIEGSSYERCGRGSMLCPRAQIRRRHAGPVLRVSQPCVRLLRGAYGRGPVAVRASSVGDDRSACADPGCGRVALDGGGPRDFQARTARRPEAPTKPVIVTLVLPDRDEMPPHMVD